MTGSWRRNVNITGKKSLHACPDTHQKTVARTRENMLNTHPKRLRNPKVSTHTPTKGHLQKTSIMPPRKQRVPRSFCFRAKK